MKQSHLNLLMPVFVIFLLAGCSSQPSQMFLLAQQAKAEAANEHAEQFATEQWIAAEKAWQEASVKLEAKSYGEADKLLLRAKTNYVKARDAAKSKREDLLKTINSYQITMEKRLKTDLLESPASAQLPAARKKEFDAAVKEIQDSKAKIANHIQNGQLVEAQLLTERTLRAIWEVQQEYLKK
jgi:membrane-bound lytic murein transglycosylase